MLKEIFGKFENKLQLAALILVLATAALLRAYHYWEVPLAGETADEIAWTWLGSSLIKEGVPASWSYFEPYQNGHIYREGILDAPVVRPALDHPPLFALVPAPLHLIDTQSDWLQIPSRKAIRLPMLFIGTANVALLYFLARKYFNHNWALVAAVIYATAPVFVLSSRLVVAENLLTTLALLLMLLVVAWQSSKAKIRFLTAALIIISVLAVMTKISGVVLPLSLVAFGLYYRDAKLARTGLTATLIGILVLILYMGSYDLPLFLEVQKSQAGRELGLSTFYNRFFNHPTIAQLVFNDGWITLGLFAFVSMLTEKGDGKSGKNWSSLIIFTMLSLGFIMLTSGEYTYHGWYSYTLFPFFAIAASLLFKRAYEGNLLLGGLIWILLAVGIKTALEQAGAADTAGNLNIRMIYLAGFLPLAAEMLKMPKLRQAALALLAASILAANLTTVFKANEFALQTQHNNYFFYLQQ